MGVFSMLMMLFASALSGVLAQSPASATATDVSRVTVGAPTVVCDLDMTLMKGEVRRLSWSPDGAYIHLQTIERETLRDYIVTLPEGIVSVAFGEPEWAVRYWAMKSDLAAPSQPGLKIEVFEDHQRTRPAPFSGGFSAGGAQTADQRNPVDTYSIEVKLKLLGEEVGYFLNNVAFGGITFGWGPPGSGAIVFVDDKGRVALFDRDRHKRTVPGTKDAVLPAWSPDGRRVAFVRKDGRRKYRLMVSAIALPRT
jgi:WD40 repeat protein